MKIRLSWTNLDTEIEGECIADLPITIGRGPDNTVVLESSSVSRLHATLYEEFGNLVLVDEQSRNGTFINAERISQAMVGDGSRFQMGQFVFKIAIVWEVEEEKDLLDTTQAQLVSEATLIFDEQTDKLTPITAAAASANHNTSFPPAFFKEPAVSEAAVRESGLPLEETTYLAVGGGLGSFAWIDGLRVSGVPTGEIVAIGFEKQPYSRYERLARHSQIPDHERLRSNSDSCPDNLWGWPGYGVREIWSSLKKGDLKTAGGVAWQLFGEPVLIEPYTPRAGDVYRSIEREAERIGWSQMWRYGRVRAIRKTDNGRYVVAYSSQASDQPTVGRHRLIMATYLHVALGYPGVRFLPDLQRYREQTHDFENVVNAYEDHDHVYEHLLQQGGQVLIRGRGIVASRIIQRLTEVRERNHNIKIMHLMRSPNVEGSLYKRAQRTVANHWELQPYNFPKACFGGDLKVVLAAASEEERSQLLDLFGGTTTADRADWQKMIQDGLAEGWYEIRFGRVLNVEREGDKIITNLQLSEEKEQLAADFIIDATGLEASVEANPLLKDLIDTYALPFNIKGRLKVGDDYELLNLRNGRGRVYAAGAMTFGNHFAPVDSFVGLQYTALLSLDTLCQLGAPSLQRLNGWRSFAAWLRWARGVFA